ncbi:MAG: hypothetical protein CMG57_04345 [Candidatus Marinimicrobia bacterium]|mgnify:FL=1|nr:hypothetical protein [Candidatus Neomarinimicrobiota bacterium]
MFKHPKIKILANRGLLVIIPRIVVAAFIILQILGMVFYPGGTIHNNTTVGYSFTENFFSDMGTHTAYNGEPNFLSMGIFIISLTLCGLTFAVYYFALPQFFKSNVLNYRLAVFGTIFSIGGSIGLIGTGLTPADVVLDPHIFFSNNIFYCFLVTALCYTIVIYRTDVIEKKYALGYGAFFIMIGLYVAVLEFGPPPRSSQVALVFQVITQKLIVVVFCSSIFFQTFGFSKILIENNYSKK